MSVEKSVLSKSSSSCSKLYSSWGHLLQSPKSTVFLESSSIPLGNLILQKLGLQWLLKLSHAGVGLDEHFGSYQARAFGATLGWSPVTIWFMLPSRQGASWIPFGWNKTEKCASGACLMHSSCSWVLSPWASLTGSPPTGVQPGVRCSARRSPACARPCGAAPLARAGIAFPSMQGAAGPHLDVLHKVWIQSPLKSLNDFHWF